MTHTTRGFAAVLFIALGLSANPVAAQRGPAAPALVGCTGDGNCSEAPFGEHIGGQTKPGVGSRAIAGIEAQDSAADQPEMATGLNLKGPPVRFPPAKTPE